MSAILIGSGEAQERAVVGETPNLAARLQEIAPASGVLVAESTRRLVGDLFQYHDLGSVALKGLPEPVPCWQVLCESTVENRFEALRSATLTPLIGREEELGLLLRRWDWVKAGEGQIVLISGEAGIGKSRIVTVLQERLEAEQPILLRCFCSPHRRDSALYPFIARLQRAARFSRLDPVARKLDKLEALLSQSGESPPPETVATLADLLGLPTEGRYPLLPTDPRQRREMTLAALVQQLEGLAQHQPVLFVTEDAHWIDATSLELLERLAERVRRWPVLMVITYRPEFEPPWTGQSQVTSLTLSRLGRRETTALIGRVAGGKALPAEILNSVVERTDGIPLFIEELTKTLLESSLLKGADGRYVLTGPLPPLALPSSLLDSLMARLDRLAPAKEVAQIGAAIGREFSYDVLAAVARRPGDQLRSALDQLVAAGLVFRRGTPPEETFLFKHAFVQDAAYDTLLRARRQELHAGIALAFEERFVDARSEHAGLLAYHWLRAEDWGKALSYSLEAAERARKLNAFPEAVTHYWQVLDLLERLPPSLERGRVRIDVVNSLVGLPGWRRDEPGQATMLRHFNLALGDAAEGPVGTIARLEAHKGIIWNDEALLIGAIDRCRSSGDAPGHAFAAVLYGAWLGSHDQLEKALPYVAQSIDMLGATGDRLQQALQMASQGRCFFARAGRLEESLAYAARAREAGDTLDNDRLRAWRAMEAEAYLYKGCWREAVLSTEEALPAAWRTGEWDVVLWSSAWAATAYLKLGQPAEARRLIDSALNEVPARGQRPWTVGVAHIALALVHLVTGDVHQALSAARRALELSEQDHQRLEIGAAHRVLGQVHAAMGDRTEADAAFRRSIEILEKHEARPELAQSLLAYGQFRRGNNMPEDRVLIGRALRLFEEMNATGWIEEADAALAAA